MTRASRWMATMLLSLTFALLVGRAQAHSASDSYLTLEARGPTLEGRWDIALRDLDYVLGLDANGDGQLSWGEVRARQADVARYALGRLAIDAQGVPCTLRGTDGLLDRHMDGTYFVLRIAGACRRDARDLAISYALLFDADTTHRGLLRLQWGSEVRTAVFSPEARTRTFARDDGRLAASLATFAMSGVHHILEGYDHLLFLLSLLLPAVVVRREGRWEPAPQAGPVVRDVVRTVTAFTVAHSITFLLASYERIEWSSRVVEAAIAGSVVAAALNNVFGLVASRRWTAAFGFGLVHGLGFASVLGALQLPEGPVRALPLLAFNVGVEAGQLAVVLAVLPILYVLRATTFYRRAVLVGGSCVIALVGTAWFAERAFEVQLPGWS